MRNQLGVSLLQVTISIGIMAAGGAALMSTMGQTGKTAKTADLKNDVAFLTEDVSLLLSDRVACTNSLGTLDAARNTGILELKNADGDVVYNTVDAFGSSRVQIASFELFDRPGMGDGVNVVPNDLGTTNLVINYRPVKGTVNETRGSSSKVKISVITDMTGRIVSCFSSGSAQSSLWAKSASNPDDIFYSMGRAGVDIDEPQAAFDVGGWIRAHNVSGESLAIGGDAANYVMQVEPAVPLVFRNQATAGLAELEVGNARASGLIFPGSTGVGCAGREGTIRYDAGSSRVQVCEAGAWRTKDVLRFCTPPNEIYKGHDEWMRFHQVSNFGPLNGRCVNAMIRSKSHSHIDATGFKVNFDDRDKPCTVNRNCVDYDPAAQ